MVCVCLTVEEVKGEGEGERERRNNGNENRLMGNLGTSLDFNINQLLKVIIFQDIPWNSVCFQDKSNCQMF